MVAQKQTPLLDDEKTWVPILQNRGTSDEAIQRMMIDRRDKHLKDFLWEDRKIYLELPSNLQKDFLKIKHSILKDDAVWTDRKRPWRNLSWEELTGETITDAVILRLLSSDSVKLESEVISFLEQFLILNSTATSIQILTCSIMSLQRLFNRKDSQTVLECKISNRVKKIKIDENSLEFGILKQQWETVTPQEDDAEQANIMIIDFLNYILRVVPKADTFSKTMGPVVSLLTRQTIWLIYMSTNTSPGEAKSLFMETLKNSYDHKMNLGIFKINILAGSGLDFDDL
jgi:hypothetical protein